MTKEQEEKLIKQHYAALLDVLEDYTDEFAKNGPLFLLTGLESLQGALTTIQSALVKTYRNKAVDSE
tara:strand:+ start:983 stop:1183 length:201 start_codon:yes stop_codon:yes gene_type:complete